jgi:hypothetical protein
MWQSGQSRSSILLVLVVELKPVVSPFMAFLCHRLHSLHRSHCRLAYTASIVAANSPPLLLQPLRTRLQRLYARLYRLHARLSCLRRLRRLAYTTAAAKLGLGFEERGDSKEVSWWVNTGPGVQLVLVR